MHRMLRPYLVLSDHLPFQGAARGFHQHHRESRWQFQQHHPVHRLRSQSTPVGSEIRVTTLAPRCALCSAGENTTLTKYRYREASCKGTGQLAQAELGLDYYVARWYDPVIGHFTQADTIIPEPGKASSWDRYSYVKNNPIRSNDPSGHCDGLVDCINEYSLSLVGVIDIQGIAIAKEINQSMGSEVSPSVLAGIAVQSQWYNPYSDLPGSIFSGFSDSPGFGYSQGSLKELNGRDPLDPGAAVDVISTRIEAGQNACIGCNDFDLFIAGGLSQNGKFDIQSVVGYSSGKQMDGLTKMDWNGYFDYLDKSMGKGDIFVIYREGLTGKKYSSRFILELYTNDYLALGGELSEEELEYLRKLSGSKLEINKKKLDDYDEEDGTYGGL